MRPCAAKPDLDKFRPARSGLLVVDMQGFFLDSDSPAFMPEARRILPKVRKLVQAFRARNRPVAFAVYKTPKSGPMVRRWRKACRTKKDLALPFDVEGGKLFVKTCYSALRGGCAAWLKRKGVRDLVVCGIKTNLCVESTVRDAFDLGFSVFVPADACGASKDILHRGSMRNMAVGFAQIMKSDTILQAF